MTDSKSLKVLLYADGSPHSFSATVYAASLFSSLSNMQLTILHIHESAQGSIEGDYNLLETWSSNPNTDWVEHLIDEDSDQGREYSEILATTNNIFSKQGQNVNRQVIYSNYNIPDITEAILSYATKKNFELIIMGTRGLNSLKGLIYGSLAHSVLNKSDIPVLLIKKLPQEFIDNYRSVDDE
ncbi:MULTISPECIES: universal stress protein [Desulfosporosinus]|uniref:Universal stress protein n=1 Tax=Desulfosporosinus nitroreducens TaxID=2018668 RepID=A0ABT8QTC1_9FIRM|nr:MULTISPECIES: universal stress protein [Desulfosporosinus]MCO5387226.1 universal stress protein [Desulfosporosinus sp.]MDA8223525.1 universal stress protein [Desulfitobacterium hafniense]MDO0824607.1 universal stress protein [Desulfosporosinus nitroreducens]